MGEVPLYTTQWALQNIWTRHLGAVPRGRSVFLRSERAGLVIRVGGLGSGV